MLKRRVPKPRQIQVTPRALQLFEQLQQIPRGTERWYDVHELLHKELGAKVWEWPLDTRNGAHIWEALLDALDAAEAAEAARRQVEVAAAK
jgi:hypothetical protein